MTRFWRLPGLLVLMAAAPLLAASITVDNTAALKEAAAKARPGARIVLKPGTYRGDCKLTGVKGSAAAMIEIVAQEAGHPPVFAGGEVGFQLIDCAYVLVEGIVAAGATVNNIQIGDGSHHIILKECVSRDIGAQGNCDGIKVPGLTDFLLYRCTIENWGAEGSGIDMVGCARGLLYQCRFRYPEVKGTTANAIQPKGGTHSLGIHQCDFDRANFRALQFGGSTGRQYFFQGNYDSGYEGLDMVAMGNVLRGGECSVAFVSCTRCVVAYNTIIDPTGYVIRVLHEGAGKPAAANTFSHNVVVYGEVREVLGRGGPSDLASFTFADNYWYNRLAPDRSIPKLPVAQKNPAGGQDPLRPTAGGPARDCGASAPGMEKAWHEHTDKFAWAWQQAQRLERAHAAQTQKHEGK